jgi:hypothetical protein
VRKEYRKKTVILFKDTLGILETSRGMAGKFYYLILIFGIGPVSIGLLILKKIRRIIRTCRIS